MVKNEMYDTLSAFVELFCYIVIVPSHTEYFCLV